MNGQHACCSLVRTLKSFEGLSQESLVKKTTVAPSQLIMIFFSLFGQMQRLQMYVWTVWQVCDIVGNMPVVNFGFEHPKLT